LGNICIFRIAYDQIDSGSRFASSRFDQQQIRPAADWKQQIRIDVILTSHISESAAGLTADSLSRGREGNMIV